MSLEINRRRMMRNVQGSFTNLDDSMSNFDYDHHSEINQINYPRVNINSGNQNRMQNIQNHQ